MSFLARFLLYLLLYGLYLRLSVRLIPRAHFELYANAPVDRAGRWLAGLTILAPVLAMLQAATVPYNAPRYLYAIGPVAYWLGSVVVILARRVNPFFLPTAMTPPRLIVTGPYRVFRHPGYIGLALQMIGVVMMLGQPGALLAAIPYFALLLFRTHQENKLLYAIRPIKITGTDHRAA